MVEDDDEGASKRTRTHEESNSSISPRWQND